MKSIDIINKINKKLNNKHFWFLCNIISMLEMGLCFLIAIVGSTINSVFTFLIFIVLTFIIGIIMVTSYIEELDIMLTVDKNKFKISALDILIVIVGIAIFSILTLVIIYSVM